MYKIIEDKKMALYFVVDYKGNKIYCGNMRDCKKFIKYMEGGQKHGKSIA